MWFVCAVKAIYVSYYSILIYLLPLYQISFMHIYKRNVEKYTTLNKTYRDTTAETTNKPLLQVFPATNQRVCIIP